MSEVCAHGNLKRQCETCAAWESAVHNQRRAEKAEARVKDLEAEIERDTSLAQMAELEDLVVRVIKRAEQAERERDEARKRVAELKAHLRKVHDRAHSWNNIPACSDIEQMAAQALGLKGGA